MNFDSSLFLVNGLVGAVFVLTGFILFKFPPKKINGLYGYRTTRSMSTQQNWDFAQKYAGKLMAKSGAILIFISIVGLFQNINKGVIAIIAAITILSTCIVLFYKTEQGMKMLNSNE
jgi:uncharacterized membrane protein